MSNINIPTGAITTKNLASNQRRVLLVGEPGEGKTFTSIITSPNPIVADMDRGITDPRLIEMDVPTFPLWDAEWCDKVLKKKNRCLAAMELLKGPAKTLTSEQTLIIDSMSSIQDDLHRYNWDMTPVGKTGQKDGLEFWDMNKDWWNEFFTRLSDLKCHVIVIGHLTEMRHKENPLITIGYRPLISGSTKDFISRFFTDMIRQQSFSKKEGEKYKTEYKWQVRKDDMFNTKCRTNVDTLHIPASFTKLLEIGVNNT